MIFWAVVGGVVVALLLATWRMDRGARRRGARVLGSGEVWREVREGVRDARVLDNSVLLPPNGQRENYGWTSWSRRNHGHRHGPTAD